MTTMVLAAAGAAIGASVNSTVLGISTMQLGQLAGATAGRMLDRRLFRSGTEVMPRTSQGGSDPIETGRIDNLRMNSVSEGTPIARVFGRVRLSGQVIWASNFRERVTAGRIGSGSANVTFRGQTNQLDANIRATYTYSYSVNLAIALCEGEIASVDRIWADGVLVPTDQLNMTVHHGRDDQLPDETMEVIEGVGNVPAYRGTAYVVFTDLDLTAFGNRVPSFTFEVSRLAPDSHQDQGFADLARETRAVALMPGTGEYSLATSPARVSHGENSFRVVNRNSATGQTDLNASLDQLQAQAPNLEAVSLIVSWFGDDLRAGRCQLKPKPEFTGIQGQPWDWHVAGIDRADAEPLAVPPEEPVYGGTPSDRSVIEAIREMNQRGIKVMFYPFILMEQEAGNILTDPYSGAQGQAVLPWRGRITTEFAPGVAGTTDATNAARDEVDAFFGSAQPLDWQIDGDLLRYTGPNEYSQRRMILHYAWLCKQAGGVDSFCIGSEMRGLTQIRAESHSFPAVEAFVQLARDVRKILGPNVKIGYASDWSEYFGYSPSGENNRYFHLDPLWADETIDFIGIDNYMPLSDWREGDAHTDAALAKRIYDPAYLMNNVAAGEGYDWFYASPSDRDYQIRSAITDGAYGEPWIWRYKDLYSWWHNPHFERIDGVRQIEPTAWEPQSKPFWFTELGCAAIDKGCNQPNKFLDPKSSESALPHYSTGARDDLMQAQYYHAMSRYWEEPRNNPNGTNPLNKAPEENPYLGPMVDTGRSFAWAWDARPYPYFPRALDLWVDGDNYGRGHWLNGRISARSLPSVVAEICQLSGLDHFDVSDLTGIVRGYLVDYSGSARSMLQPLAQTFGFDAMEMSGRVVFRMRDGVVDHELDAERLASVDELPFGSELVRGHMPEREGRLRLGFVETDGEFESAFEEAILADDVTHSVAEAEMPVMLTASEGRIILERWLSEARIGTERARIALPPSLTNLNPGDVVALSGTPNIRWRIERLDGDITRIAEMVRVSETPYSPAELEVDQRPIQRFFAPVPVTAMFMDLPYLGRRNENALLPWVAMWADPWPGSVVLLDSPDGQSFEENTVVAAAATMGRLTDGLNATTPALIDEVGIINVRLDHGRFNTISESAFLDGGNLAAIGDGSPQGWEIIQFRDAVLNEDGVWQLSHILRGQYGTDADMPATWPSGSQFVLLDSTPRQVQLAANQIGASRIWRWGPVDAPIDDAAFQQAEITFQARGLQPYQPSHLNAEWQGEELVISWQRRTRIGGDNWAIEDVPLGESDLEFRLRLSDSNGNERQTLALRNLTTNGEGYNWTFSESNRLAWGLGTSFLVEVAQFSPDLGQPGPYASMLVNVPMG